MPHQPIVSSCFREYFFFFFFDTLSKTKNTSLIIRIQIMSRHVNYSIFLCLSTYHCHNNDYTHDVLTKRKKVMIDDFW